MDKGSKLALACLLGDLTPEALEERGVTFDDDDDEGPPQCNVMFCILDPHDGNRHVDVTGHGWTEETPDSPVLAHVIHGEGSRTRILPIKARS